MSKTQRVSLLTGDWLRGPGDFYEVQSTIKKCELTIDDKTKIFEVAKTLYGAVASLDEIDETDSLLLRARVLTWISASSGVIDACSVLADEIRSHIQEVSPHRSEALVWMEIASRWDQRAVGQNPAPRTAREGLKLRPSRSDVKEEIQELIASSEDDDEEVSDIEADGLVVVPSIGDSTSQEGASIARRFGNVVGKTLPSRISMPEAGVIASVIKAEWPWAEKIGIHIENMLVVQRVIGVKKPKLKPMLFVGPPGSGKTALALRVAELFGLPTWMVATGSTGDAAGLASVTRGWSGSRPSGPVVAVAQHECCDPAIIIDEIDKGVGPGSRNGSVAGTLLGMLGTPEKFQDSCLLADVNLSRMVFMATANSLQDINPALLDRFTILMVPRPSKEHFPIVLQNIRERVAREHGVRQEMLPLLNADEYEVLRRRFEAQEGSLRDFQRAFDYMLSQAAQREVVSMQMNS